ncbi:unnamed protein product [Caretta caretta]
MCSLTTHLEEEQRDSGVLFPTGLTSQPSPAFQPMRAVVAAFFQPRLALAGRRRREDTDQVRGYSASSLWGSKPPAKRCTTSSADNIISLLWWTEWEKTSAMTRDAYIISRPEWLPGFGLPSHLWSQLNKFRFPVPKSTTPGASMITPCTSVVLWGMLHTCWMVALFMTGSLEVFSS